MTNAGIYVRISKDLAGQQLGITRQADESAALAQQLGWRVHDTYVDNDISATAGRRRPAYERLLDDIRSGLVDAIIAWHPDRLYRRVTDLGELTDVCKTHDTQIATVRAGNIDLTTPTGRLVAGLLAQVALYEVEHKSDRWLRAVDQKRRAGIPPNTGSRLFGYNADHTIRPDEQAIAEQMLDDLLTGVPILGISRRLQSEGVRPTRGGTWRPGTIRQYLDNPKIAGYATLRGEIVGEGQWEPLVDRDKWHQARALVQARRRPYVPRKSLLLGLVHCGREGCGNRLITGMSRNKKRNYHCDTRPGMNGCNQSIAAEYVDAMVTEYAQEKLATPAVRQRLAELDRSPNHGAELAGIDARILELEQELDRLDRPVSAIVSAIGRLRERQAALLEAGRTHRLTSVPDGRRDWPEDLWRRRALIDLVVARVEVHPVRPIGRFDPDRVDIIPVEL